MEVVVTTGAIRRAKLQSNHHHQQTNTQFFTGRMPFLSPNEQCQSTEGKISHFTDLLIPSLPGGIPTLSLISNSSWLSWGRVAMPLISPLMPVPSNNNNNSNNQIPIVPCGIMQRHSMACVTGVCSFAWSLEWPGKSWGRHMDLYEAYTFRTYTSPSQHWNTDHIQQRT